MSTGVFMLVEWLRCKVSKGQGFPCSYTADILCEWDKSSPHSIALFLYAYSRHGSCSDGVSLPPEKCMQVLLEIEYSCCRCCNLKNILERAMLHFQNCSLGKTINCIFQESMIGESENHIEGILFKL